MEKEAYSICSILVGWFFLGGGLFVFFWGGQGQLFNCQGIKVYILIDCI